MSRNITPDQNDENIDYGRFLHEQTYTRSKKEIAFGNVKFDLLFKSEGELVIGETKSLPLIRKLPNGSCCFICACSGRPASRREGSFFTPKKESVSMSC